MDKPGLEALLTSLDNWAALFIAFVVIGVAGELVVHLLYSRASARLIAFQHAEEQTLQTEMSRLGSITAEANKAAAQANERANQMEVQAEELRRQNLEIQRKINPRFLTTTEQQTILDAIRPFRGHRIILTRLGDGEAGPYGDSIIGIFQKAGWTVQVNNVGMYMPPTYGIVCRVSTHPDAAARDLIAAFAKAKIELTIQHVDAAPEDSWIDMLVGLKPVK
ncbi:MAG TPA: hypothetical protein VHF01_00315 [Candidatus Acidoferrum sp.]|nr:hypothetical protein [Candidatus Acidoferrum sp.]